MRPPELTPELLIQAYASGIFPMAESRCSAEVFWVDPQKRGILPLDGFHISRSLARAMRRNDYQIAIDRDFTGAVAACADRSETWINDTIHDLYVQLHRAGLAHSLEVWDGPELIGAVYGVALGGAFFGESMFSRRTDASKIALAYLVDHLRRTGFRLFDTQFITPHLASLGAVEISRTAYHNRLRAALDTPADFLSVNDIPTAQEVIQRNSQTS
ncbi:MAG: leucyl/phenylalanyl-tRNA--protein transferase [Rhodobacter sp.]|nr:leucyl/phenylalanyl-tRNA--protein transferase [Rhodobacter sp.]